jgi:hypothetical protein
MAFLLLYAVLMALFMSRGLTNLKEDLREMTQRLESVVDAKLAELKTEVRGDLRKIHGQMDQLDKRLDDIQGKMDHMQGKISSLVGNVSILTQESMRNEGRFAFGVAEGSRVYITIWQGGHFSGSGCGVYVQLGGRYYVATNAHVAREAFPSGDFHLFFSDGRQLHPRTDAFFYDNGPDVALIPVDPYRGVDQSIHQPVEVTDDPADLGTQLYGISSAFKSRTAVHCAAVNAYDNDTTLANCRGTYGHSGTGYFDRNGILVFLHQGAADTLHNGLVVSRRFSSEGGSYDKIWKRIEEVCQPGWIPATATPAAAQVVQSPSLGVSVMPVIQPECFEALEEAYNINAQNPTGILVSAHFLHRLFNDYQASGGTRRLTFRSRTK